jgi:flavin reductase (DIM6/NTAB) family NADH-FMN oxidoreductase RutF
MKKSVPIKQFWYSDIFVIPKAVTVITTLNKDGIINAAPYAYFMQYDVLKENPRIFLGMRKFTHTYQNIAETGEFVINFPSFDYLEDIMEACRFYPEGVNELDNTKFTAIPSLKVAPPSIKECGQIIECKLNKQYELDAVQGHIIGDIVALVFDEELIELGREERFRKLDLPISIGDEKRKYMYFGKIDKIEMHTLKSPPDQESEEELKTGMEWDPEAFKGLQNVPVALRQMVVEMSEDVISKEGADKVTYERYLKLVEEYAPKDLQNRFDEDVEN